jgi:hypothetical protein
MHRLTKLLLSLLAAVLLVPSTTACSFIQEGGDMILRSVFRTEHDIAADRLKAVLTAIEQKDGDALKSEFSEKALSEAEDIDGCIEYLFGLVKGDVVSWEEDTLGLSEKLRYGKISKMIYVWYTLTTTEDTYTVFMVDYYKDTIDPDNQGLYALRIYRNTDAATQGGDSVSMRIPGVYKPEGS